MAALDDFLSFLQGASNSAASAVSAPVDGINWALGKVGVPVSKKPVGGSEWLKELGFTAEPKNKTAGLLGEAVGGVLPIVAQAKAPQIAAGINQMISNAQAPAVLRKESGMFIGPSAKTWDAEAAKKAQTLAAKGVDPRQIWKETGTFKGPDGAWRQEIDDTRAGMRLLGPKFGDETNLNKLGETLDHKLVYQAYPDAKKINVTYSDAASGGSYTTPRTWAEYIDLPQKAGKEVQRSTALHEMQHAIQQREGWAMGGSPELFTQQADAVTARDAIAWADELEQVRRANPGMDAIAAENQLIKSYQDMDFAEAIPSRTARDLARQPGVLFQQPNALNQKKDLIDLRNLYGLDKRTTPYRSEDLYRRLAGEAEARATQARMNLNAAQRRELFPLDSYDVPVDQLIVRGLID